ncbi:hypothetical protein RISK_006365 [Rhodopirellula islandica]|uniref:Uncharacterized protein n=1 Tax=Rhodopirellula islandica TaxID=595434 RepID=A0A0J1E880_RHOIS|nr:hypothetical protein RISK_006365 [Rhodopirellula islandica]
MRQSNAEWAFPLTPISWTWTITSELVRSRTDDFQSGPHFAPRRFSHLNNCVTI